VKLAAQAPRQEDSESLAVVWKHASKAVISHAPLSIVIPDARAARDRDPENPGVYDLVLQARHESLASSTATESIYIVSPSSSPLKPSLSGWPRAIAGRPGNGFFTETNR
jgi:hypothetical protein